MLEADRLRCNKSAEYKDAAQRVMALRNAGIVGKRKTFWKP